MKYNEKYDVYLQENFLMLICIESWLNNCFFINYVILVWDWNWYEWQDHLNI
jgi:hypothetical protein